MYELFDVAFAAKYNYWAYTVLMMIGIWAMIGKNNLVKKVIGMSIFQTSIILFYVSIGSKKGGTIPILMHAHGGEHMAINAADYINPLPHVLMLTAIVVSVATLGVALALLLNIYKKHKTLEEDEILKHLSE
ncbi:cation:proton antiporter subunit C [Desulfobaculum bizertense]|uniref:Multisubunit sodium/proton antiporter, MrpC subunit n=1 Tax=Desulfobaculum bizertense DSM 18034 TaxID=1121442 RepID=A0A1T4W7T6_9BACT|nr:cation:proton antiporter subunit C [Desulfobaculum bizertense]UIJ39129.1 cation:proton antiporter subunit C [Desulfobaculum bizertense]SKA73179.1 multisubunit sodium/proton antiporter, MrpC subunit [Desulfobaculum bizertense DSM 18034]